MGDVSTAALAILQPVSRLVPHKSEDSSKQPSSATSDSAMGIVPTMQSFFSIPTFHRFPDFPLEIRLKIYHCALDPPSPQIIPAKLRSGGVTLYPRLPHFPPSILALMHTSREARIEILATFQFLRFPVKVPVTALAAHNSSLSPGCVDCWPAPRCNGHFSSLERRWQTRGSHLVNVRCDTVFFGRWATRDLQRVYGKDFIPALIFALSEIHYVAISMQSWKEAGTAWLRVLRGLGKLKEVVFVREVGRGEQRMGISYVGAGLGLVKLSDIDGEAHGFSGELWKTKIMADLEKEKSDWPLWKVPRMDFKGLVEGMPFPVREEPLGGEMIPALSQNQRFRKLRDGFSRRRR